MKVSSSNTLAARVVASLTSQASFVLCAQQAEEERVRQGERRAAEAERREEETRHKKLSENLDLALQGLSFIFELGKSPEVQRILDLYAKTPSLMHAFYNPLSRNQPVMVFYGGSFYGTDEKDGRDCAHMYVLLLEEGIALHTDSYAERSATVEVSYGTERHELRKFLLDFNAVRKNGEPIIRSFLREEKYRSLFRQQESGFDWYALLGRVLIECGQPKRFREYARRMFERHMVK